MHYLDFVLVGQPNSKVVVGPPIKRMGEKGRKNEEEKKAMQNALSEKPI